MLGATAYMLSIDKEKSSENSNSCTMETKDEVGSHYFVAHARVHKGEQFQSVDERSFLGESSSIFFNGQLRQNSDKLECSNGTVISTTLWDVNRINLLDYKVIPSVASR